MSDTKKQSRKLNSAKTSETTKKSPHRAIKYRAYPRQEQITLFCKTIGCKRKVWNLILSDTIKQYKTTKKRTRITPAPYKTEFEYLKEVDSLALANVQQDLEKAFSLHWKNPGHFGFPKYKSKKRDVRSYTTNNKQGTNTIAVGKNAVGLPKMGYIKIEKHREVPAEWHNARIKSATFSQASDGAFYISVMYEYDEQPEQQDTFDASLFIGLDYKSDGLYCDSNGELADMPKFYRKSQKRIVRLQRQLARKQGFRKGEEHSHNYDKLQAQINKLYCHSANQRRDFHHKLSYRIANCASGVAVESLNMQSIANKKRHLGKATYDNGYGQFCTYLEYKLKDRGKPFVRVDKYFPSSQLCSVCGSQQKLELSERTYVCPNCGTVIDRDLNAAINIKAEGLRILSAQGS